MQLLDREILQAKAMIIDGNASSRSLMAAQLRDLGVQEVRQVARVQDARLALERQPHDIVLCATDFEGAPMSGQDLLDELRREQLLPYSTAFILVTGSASYAQVMEAAESTVDGYLVKPYSAQALSERLAQARKRKRALEPLYAAMRSGDAARAAAMAQQRFEARESHWRLAAQMAAELWLRAGEPQRALAVFEAVLAQAPQGWARLGVARVHLAQGELSAARRQLQELVSSDSGNADAHDLLARVCLEQGKLETALEALRTASTLTPGCLLRLQHRGALAFHVGAHDEAERQLERVVALGRGSKLLDPLSLALLALLKFDRREARALGAALEALTSCASTSAPTSAAAQARVARMQLLASALAALQARKPDEALRQARALAGAWHAPDFDLEAAVLAATLWVRLPADGVDGAELQALLRNLAQRVCVSKATTQTLLAVTQQHTLAAEAVRQGQAEITRIAEQAMNLALQEQAVAAVELLLTQGESTGNAKLVELAAAVARRHAEHLPDAQALQARAQALHARFGAAATQLAGVQRSARQPGGVALRH